MRHTIPPYRMAKSFSIYTFLVASLLILNTTRLYGQKDSAKYKTGQTFFRELCSSCHSAHQEIYGPMLGSITKKRKTEWLIPFIQNSQAVIKSGDAYAQALFEKYEHQIMPPFKELSADDIQAILYYLELESIQPGEYFNDADIASAKDSNVIKGKQEFLDHCSMCHFIHKESDFAPALGSVTKRHSREWLISFIQNSQKKIKGNDAYAKHLFEQFNENVMTSMDFIPVDEINSILDYIEFASTIDPTYKEELNKKVYKNQAIRQIQDVAERFPVVAIICFIVLLPVLFSMIILLTIMHQFRKNRASDTR